MTKYKLPFIGDYSKAVKLTEDRHIEMLNNVLDYFEKNPRERFYYCGTGDTVVCGFNHDDELVIMDTKIRKEYTFTKVR